MLVRLMRRDTTITNKKSKLNGSGTFGLTDRKAAKTHFKPVDYRHVSCFVKLRNISLSYLIRFQLIIMFIPVCTLLRTSHGLSLTRDKDFIRFLGPRW